MNRIGIIGLGLLGSALAERFLLHGWSVRGHDRSEEARSRFLQHGGIPLENNRAIADDNNLILLSLPNSDVVAEVVNEIETQLPGKTIIDTTTGDPDVTAALGQRLANLGVTYIDATVAGSSEQARQGEVVVMAGGTEQTYVSCEAIFCCFARRSFHVGPWGSGARMKLVVNLVLGLNRAVLAEGLVFAKQLGLDPNAALEILRDGPASSKAMDAKGRKMLEGDFSPVARLSQHHKDVRLILEAATRVGLDLPLSRLHDELLERAEALGFGEQDNSSIIRAFGVERPQS